MSKIDQNIDQANKLGNLLNSWTKIFIGLGVAVISCAMAYYEIYENKDDIIKEREERISNEIISEERSDKRYARAMETAKELKDYIKYQEGRLLEMEKKHAQLEGYIKGKEYNEKHNYKTFP